MTSLAISEFPLYAVGENIESTIGSVVLANHQDISNVAIATVHEAIAEAIGFMMMNNDNDNDDDDGDGDGDWMNSWRDDYKSNEKTTGEEKDNDNTRSKKRKKKKIVSKDRLRARKFGEKKKRWEKYKMRNAIEVEKFQKEMKIKNDIEQTKRNIMNDKLKPINEYKEYFGYDVRKAYPYSKYTSHLKQINELQKIDKNIKQMTEDIHENVMYRAAHTLFETKESTERLKKKREDLMKRQLIAKKTTKTKEVQSKSSFLTNNKSSKLLFAGSMDVRTHEAEMNQAWNHYKEGLSIWDAVRLGDVPRCKELLESSRKYRNKVLRYKKKGWLPLPTLERDHLNARGVDGQTPLHLVVMMRDNELHDEIFHLLMEHDANIAAQTIEG
jgi:hypothetical protein